MWLVDRGVKWTAAAEAIITPTTGRLLTPHSLLACHDHDRDRDRGGGGQGLGSRSLKHFIQSAWRIRRPLQTNTSRALPPNYLLLFWLLYL